jgi:hypothetical protein
MKPGLNYYLNLKLLLSLASNREDISVICVELYRGKICVLFVNTRFVENLKWERVPFAQYLLLCLMVTTGELLRVIMHEEFRTS